MTSVRTTASHAWCKITGTDTYGSITNSKNEQTAEQCGIAKGASLLPWQPNGHRTADDEVQVCHGHVATIAGI